jgi:hypothetical protein
MFFLISVKRRKYYNNSSEILDRWRYGDNMPQSFMWIPLMIKRPKKLDD